jgi:hypothetical protein
MVNRGELRGGTWCVTVVICVVDFDAEKRATF